MTKTTTTISNLSGDLLEAIFSRVPSECMRKVRSTCKRWNTVTQASAARQGESRMVVLMDNDLHLVSVFADKENPSADVEGKLKEVEISQVLNCEGLLLCILRNNDTKVAVWNPVLGQKRWIETRYSYRGQKDMYVYAIGHVKKKKKTLGSYKILRFFDNDVRVEGVEKRFTWYEIYEFDSNSWRTLDDVSPAWYIRTRQRGVSLKGNTYFCANGRPDDNVLDGRLVCFDYTSEEFGPLLRFPFEAQDVDYVAISCVREEKLAVLLTHDEIDPYDVGVWITTKIGPEEVSWSKFLTLDTRPHYPISSRSFFVDEENKVVMGFDEDGNWIRHGLSIVGEAGYLRRLLLGGSRKKKNRPSTHVCSYVPSTVRIYQHEGRGGDESKQQEKLEKHRYDEKMSTVASFEEPVLMEESTQGECFEGGGKRNKRDN